MGSLRQQIGRSFLRQEDTTVQMNLQGMFKEIERRLHDACNEMDSLLSFQQQLKLKLGRAQLIGALLNVAQLKMQILTVQGVYNMYHHFAEQKAEQLQQIWRQLQVAGYTDEELSAMCS